MCIRDSNVSYSICNCCGATTTANGRFLRKTAFYNGKLQISGGCIVVVENFCTKLPKGTPLRQIWSNKSLIWRCVLAWSCQITCHQLHPFSLSLPTQNTPFPQIIPTVVFQSPLDGLHSYPACSSVAYFSFFLLHSLLVSHLFHYIFCSPISS